MYIIVVYMQNKQDNYYYDYNYVFVFLLRYFRDMHRSVKLSKGSYIKAVGFCIIIFLQNEFLQSPFFTIPLLLLVIVVVLLLLLGTTSCSSSN